LPVVKLPYKKIKILDDGLIFDDKKPWVSNYFLIEIILTNYHVKPFGLKYTHFCITNDEWWFVRKQKTSTASSCLSNISGEHVSRQAGVSYIVWNFWKIIQSRYSERPLLCDPNWLLNSSDTSWWNELNLLLYLPKNKESLQL